MKNLNEIKYTKTCLDFWRKRVCCTWPVLSNKTCLVSRLVVSRFQDHVFLCQGASCCHPTYQANVVPCQPRCPLMFNWTKTKCTSAGLSPKPSRPRFTQGAGRRTMFFDKSPEDAVNVFSRPRCRCFVGCMVRATCVHSRRILGKSARDS